MFCEDRSARLFKKNRSGKGQEKKEEWFVGLLLLRWQPILSRQAIGYEVFLLVMAGTVCMSTEVSGALTDRRAGYIRSSARSKVLKYNLMNHES